MNKDDLDKVVTITGNVIMTFMILALGYFGFVWALSGPL